MLLSRVKKVKVGRYCGTCGRLGGEESPSSAENACGVEAEHLRIKVIGFFN